MVFLFDAVKSIQSLGPLSCLVQNRRAPADQRACFVVRQHGEQISRTRPPFGDSLKNRALDFPALWGHLLPAANINDQFVSCFNTLDRHADAMPRTDESEEFPFAPVIDLCSNQLIDGAHSRWPHH